MTKRLYFSLFLPEPLVHQTQFQIYLQQLLVLLENIASEIVLYAKIEFLIVIFVRFQKQQICKQCVQLVLLGTILELCLLEEKYVYKMNVSHLIHKMADVPAVLQGLWLMFNLDSVLLHVARIKSQEQPSVIVMLDITSILTFMNVSLVQISILNVLNALMMLQL